MNQSRGFMVLTTAIFMIVLVVSATMALFALARADVMRSARGATDAQLRQLLHAGAITCAAHLSASAGPKDQFTVQVPQELGAGATIMVQLDHRSDSECHAMITARLEGMTLAQRIEFRLVEGKWRSVGALLLSTAN